MIFRTQNFVMPIENAYQKALKSVAVLIDNSLSTILKKTLDKIRAMTKVDDVENINTLGIMTGGTNRSGAGAPNYIPGFPNAIYINTTDNTIWSNVNGDDADEWSAISTTGGTSTIKNYKAIVTYATTSLTTLCTIPAKSKVLDVTAYCGTAFPSIDTDYKCVLNFNGTNQSQVFTDSSSQNLTASTTASTTNCSLSTTSPWGGTASVYFGGTTLTDIVKIQNHTSFYIGTAAHTTEFRFKANVNNVAQYLYYLKGIGASGANRPYSIQINSSGYLCFHTESTSNHDIVGTTVVTTGVWHHVAVTRVGDVFTLALDGVSEGTVDVGTGVAVGPYSSITGNYLGGDNASTRFNGGYIDAFMRSNIARYTSYPFTPATSELSFYLEIGTDADDNEILTSMSAPTVTGAKDLSTFLGSNIGTGKGYKNSSTAIKVKTTGSALSGSVEFRITTNEYVE